MHGDLVKAVWDAFDRRANAGGTGSYEHRARSDHNYMDKEVIPVFKKDGLVQKTDQGWTVSEKSMDDFLQSDEYADLRDLAP